MKASSILLTAFSCFLATNLAASEALPKSLKESIAIAVKNNPKTVSTNERLEAIRFQTLATKADMYPTISISCSSSLNTGNLNYSGATTPSRSKSGDCRASVNINIYDGKSSYYRFKADEASEAATAAAYNTTDSLIPNTRGGLANQAMNIFVELADLRGSIHHTNTALSFLRIFEKISDDYTLKSTIVETQQELEQFNASLQLQKEAFQYTVTLPPSDDLDDLDTTIGTLKIPASTEDAITLALSNGPEVIRRNLNVQMAEYNLKAIKGSLGPSVSLSLNAGKSLYKDKTSPINSYNSNRNNIGLSVSIPLGAAGSYRIKSSEANLASKISEREAAIADAKYSISAQYKRLANLKSNYIANNKNYIDQLEYLESLSSSIDKGETLTIDIQKILTAVENLNRKYYQLQRTQNSILYTLFGIQQVTGQLFSEFALL